MVKKRTNRPRKPATIDRVGFICDKELAELREES